MLYFFCVLSFAGVMKGHTDAVVSVAVTPDGHHIISGSDDKTIRVWDLASGTEIKKLEGHTNRVYSVAVTPDGRHIVSGSNDKTILVRPTMVDGSPFYESKSKRLPYGCIKNISRSANNVTQLIRHDPRCLLECSDKGDTVLMNAIRERNMPLIDVILEHATLVSLFTPLAALYQQSFGHNGDILSAALSTNIEVVVDKALQLLSKHAKLLFSEQAFPFSSFIMPVFEQLVRSHLLLSFWFISRLPDADRKSVV